MALPCEIAIWDTVPKIRADLSRELVKSGMKQKDVAEKLGLTASAVSQYIHKKRGENSETSAEYKQMIAESAEKIIRSSSGETVNKIMCKCCTRARSF